MTKPLTTLLRHQIDADAWDACVANSRQRILYGYSWYLDAVLPSPDWKWIGLVMVNDDGTYRAVMPIPLRRKRIAGIPYSWVVHQPFFCQRLDLFRVDDSVDPAPFFRAMQQRFRYGSTFSTGQCPNEILTFDDLKTISTQTLDLSVGYPALYQHYSNDRKQNLKRALSANWTIEEAVDPEPLITLFLENHAHTIDGGVADWALTIFRDLVSALHEHQLITLCYACLDGKIEAGTLFVREGNRLIYLFNAASKAGRRGNARTVLIDQMIREHAGQRLIFDFESPEKPSIRQFYQSFGAVEESFWTMRWNRLSRTENLLRVGRRLLRS
ncbi:GNAT family N-acetyltransferase [Spirosoma aerophilum]